MPQYYKRIPGWGQLGPFYECVAESLPENAILVEIGVWQGRSAVFMAEKLCELNKPAKFYLVDSFDGGKILAQAAQGLATPLLEIVKSHLRSAGVADKITDIIASLSVIAARRFEDRSIDFAFIDADHDYASVRADILAWWPKIKVGGLLAGHDYKSYWVGVAQAVDELVVHHALDFQYAQEAWQIRKRSHDPDTL